jgi:hypothetical protein
MQLQREIADEALDVVLTRGRSHGRAERELKRQTVQSDIHEGVETPKPRQDREATFDDQIAYQPLASLINSQLV